LVSGLKVSPIRATRLPSKEWRSRRSLWITSSRCRPFIATAASKRTGSYPYSRAAARRAATSFGKHDPPQPILAPKNRGPILASRPMPVATPATSAPVSSQRLEISLIKLILVAIKALAAYWIISALAKSVVTNGTDAFCRGSNSVGKLCRMMGP